MDFHRKTARAPIVYTEITIGGISFADFYCSYLISNFSLQISNFTEFDKASLNNRTYSVPVQPLRGKILDRNGEVISENIATFDLVTTPRDIKDVDEFLEKIEKLLILIKMRSIFTSKILILRHFLIESWFLKKTYLKLKLQDLK